MPLVAAWALAVAACDLSGRRVPNTLLAVAAVPAVAQMLIFGHGPLGAGRADGLAGAALAGAVWLPGYLLHKVGGGDVKFAACIGLLLGTAAAVEAMLIAALMLGVMGAGAWLLRRRSARLPAALPLAGGLMPPLIWGPLWLG
ncbi:MAG: prepilin peptidase [Pseudomonadota bacterium]